MPRTLNEIFGRTVKPARLGTAPLVLIDCQNDYLSGPLALSGIDAAVEATGRLLDAARARGSKVIHVVQRGAAGGLFDLGGPGGAVIDRLAPLDGESIVVKARPNGFSDTTLLAELGECGGEMIIAGFMTHNCVSSTARAALDLGILPTVAADATATRDLQLFGRITTAAELQRAELAGLADRHAVVVTVADLVAE
ncbi:cysteine hydrolase [Pleomorphomonas diazotrophica]|uniref:Cysteine hydrolase n=1 Tax=Pleomorphomonas diazotrophica TaxID=1166257 RepID=A0A1I4R8N5_9HYPH|nr:cysteine hydrolase family protein [Pleomorphomonas diazotrophica]PKR90136.1 cysteine hydrolase [Pleomorphomonas diazotrophica]SFM48243.1 Nicotinamidase-related amidase [Pleomorphomonas diazotrophica]